MGTSAKHLIHQRKVIGAFAKAALKTAMDRGKPKRTSGDGLDVPGRLLSCTVTAPPADLVRDYVRYCGGNTANYRGGIVPAHMFSQWAFPLITESMTGLGFELTRVLNYGCDLLINAPLSGKKFTVSAQLIAVEESERSVRLHTKVTTGDANHQEAVVAIMKAHFPKPRKKTSTKRRRKPVTAGVSLQAQLLCNKRFSATAGRDFAILTGDINPIHWVRPYAKAAGFKNTILHGFAQFGWVAESLIQTVFSGDPHRLRELTIQFKKPLLLPGNVNLYLTDDRQYAVAAARGASPFGLGEFNSGAR